MNTMIRGVIQHKNYTFHHEPAVKLESDAVGKIQCRTEGCPIEE